MIPIIAGTVRNVVELEWLDSKWQQKKESGKIFQKELTPEERMLNLFQEDMQKMRENNDMASVRSKLKSGEALTAEEIAYIQKNAPELYREYQEIKAEKEAYERQLRNCRTKEEVERVKINKVNGILSQARSVLNNPNIPKSAKLGLAEKFLMKTTGIEKVHQEFVKSGKYAELPTEEEVAEERREKAEAVRDAAEALAPKETKSEEKTEAEGKADAGKRAETEEKTDAGERAEAEGKADAGKRAEAEENADAVVKPESMEVGEISTQRDANKEDLFMQVHRELVDFIRKNGAGGAGLEYLTKENDWKIKMNH